MDSNEASVVRHILSGHGQHYLVELIGTFHSTRSDFLDSLVLQFLSRVKGLLDCDTCGLGPEVVNIPRYQEPNH